jgi:hypothetical protein
VTTNYTMLLHLPDGNTPELVRHALASEDQDSARNTNLS